MWNVWANAKIDHGTAPIYGGGRAVRNFGLDEVLLVFIVLEQVQQICFSTTEIAHVEHLKEFLL